MPQPLEISKGLVTSVGRTEINAGYASDYRNLIKNDAGSDVDRPAISEFASIGSYKILGLFYFRPADCVVAVTDEGADARKLWKITESGLVTDITGTVLDGNSRPVFASDGTYLAIAGGGAPLQWDGTTTTTALAGSPPDCTHISYLDGYWILHLLDDQEFRWAGPTAVARATWNSGNFFQAEGLPDNIKAQGVLLRELYAFGAESTEIYQNFGSTSTPFQRTFFIDRGIGAVHSLIQADNTFYWLDEKRNIVRMEGRTPKIISDDIATTIKGFTTIDDCFASHIEINGHYLLTFTFPTEQRTFCFDYKRGIWGEWDTQIDGVSSRLNLNCHVYVKEWNKHLVGDPSIGKIYELNFDNKTDDVYPLRRVRTMTYDWGTSNKKKSNYYLFHVKRGVATATVTDPKFWVQVNDDNKGWTTEKEVPLGEIGSEWAPIRVNLRGIYRRRELRIIMTDAVDFVLNKIEEEVEGAGA